MKRIAVALCGLLFTVASVDARPVKLWQPEELYEKADLVLIGVVTKIEDTKRTSTIQLGRNPALAVRVFRATTRIVEIVKGKATGPVIVQYAPLERRIIGGVENGPDRFSVQAGNMYLLYLKRTPDGTFFVGALDGQYDDDQAVKLLSSDTNRTPNKANAGDGK